MISHLIKNDNFFIIVLGSSLTHNPHRFPSYSLTPSTLASLLLYENAEHTPCCHSLIPVYEVPYSLGCTDQVSVVMQGLP